MLDQNTDRMWYVIGAVLIGAAIILIANGTVPQMFASVTDTFEDVSTEPLSEIGSMDVNMSAQGEAAVNYFDVDMLQTGIDQKVSDRTGRWNNASASYNSYILELELKPNTKYKLSTNVPKATNTGNQTLYFNYWGTGSSVYKGHDGYATSDTDGYIFVGMPQGREHTAGVLDGTYWVRLEEVNE